MVWIFLIVVCVICIGGCIYFTDAAIEEFRSGLYLWKRGTRSQAHAVVSVTSSQESNHEPGDKMCAILAMISAAVLMIFAIGPIVGSIYLLLHKIRNG